MNYYNYISGGMTPSHLMAALSFAAMGWLSYKVVTGATRVKHSIRTPVKWSWKFWVKDNWKEAVTHAVIMFILVRFASEILAKTIPNSAEYLDSKDPMWIYLVVGVAKSFILDKIKKKNGKV